LSPANEVHNSLPTIMQNKQRRAKNGSVLQMIQLLNSCATTSHDDEAALLLGIAAKALAQLQSHSDRVMVEAVDWKDKCEQMGQLYQELEDKNGDLAKENRQLLVKCQQLDGQMDGLADENELLDCEFLPAKASLDASLMKDTATTDKLRTSSFSGDVYGQLDQFELSLDMELEDFDCLGFLPAGENQNNTGVKNIEESVSEASESEEISSLYLEALAPLQDRTLKTSEGSLGAPSRNPLHLLQRVFRTQADMSVPAMTTSDSMFSFSSDCSISTRSMSDLLGFAPMKRTTKMLPQPNAEWAIIE